MAVHNKDSEEIANAFVTTDFGVTIAKILAETTAHLRFATMEEYQARTHIAEIVHVFAFQDSQVHNASKQFLVTLHAVVTVQQLDTEDNALANVITATREETVQYYQIATLVQITSLVKMEDLAEQLAIVPVRVSRDTLEHTVTNLFKIRQ